MAGIRDVARLAHVSTSTVSLVLNKSGYVSDKTREKVETAMRELNYIPNELARNLYHSKTNIVGLILPDIAHPFFGSFAKYAEMELYKEGRIRAIGVSNFMPHHLKALMETEIIPMVDQIEFHPGWIQNETVKYCKENMIQVEAWSPLGNGRVLNHPNLQQIAQKYGKTIAQICIRWCLQHQVLPLSKSVTPSRIKENSEVFDFSLLPEDMEQIDKIENFGNSGSHPDKINF